MYKAKTTPTFEKDILGLDKQVAKRISAKIDFLTKNPQLLNDSIRYAPKDLKGLKKYRIGDWRILFWVDHNKQEITLYGVDNRGRVYRRLHK